jgi:uracil-DNA glycosylase
MHTVNKLNTWQPLLDKAYKALDSDYRVFLEANQGYFPDKDNYLNAFKTLARDEVKYILFGQDPYPRKESAGGYAFIDMRVKDVFSSNGLSIEVNKATSLRNFIKMALVASERLNPIDTSQKAITKVNKTDMINSIDALRQNFENQGVLLLNTALVFTDKSASSKHIKAWRAFMRVLLNGLIDNAPTLILFGTHAKALKKHFPIDDFSTISLEHPYNQSFITNPKAEKLFKQMNLLAK